MASYKQRCSVCKEQWVLVSSWKTTFPVCTVCEMKEVQEPLEDAALAKLFDIPLAWYEQNSFLRSIRYQYGRFGRLTDKQLEAFKKTLKDMKAQDKKT